jgi:acyl-CoA reductase-like NAD-dependent aldehyde dehydrogenase
VTITVTNKVTTEAIDTIGEEDARSTAAAVARAKEAFVATAWSRDARLRQEVLRQWGDALAAGRDELVDLLLSETGKIRPECVKEVDFAIDALRFNSGMPRLVSGSAHTLSDGSAGHLVREPVGVAAFIVPWNWPLFLLFRVTAVVKPSPFTPLTIMRALELAPADLPTDVVQVVNGGAEVGETLSAHDDVAAVAFTGSSVVGRAVGIAAAGRFAKAMLELGGKGASILLPDADVDAAIPAIMANAFITAGQMCMANTRVLVHRSRFSDVRDALAERVGALSVGDPGKPGTDVGAIISATQRDRIDGYLQIARAEGSLLVGGDRLECGGGAFLAPALISADRIDDRLRQEEIFGPVVTVEPFDTEDQAVALANDTEYGLAAAVWTQDVTAAWRAARRLDFGTVWINRYNRTFAEVPSGGMKSSGAGRTRGFEGVYEFTELKHINFGIDD